MSDLPKRFPDRADIAGVPRPGGHARAGGELEYAVRRGGSRHGSRDMGRLVFVDLVDRSGKIQLLVEPGRVEGFEVDLGDIVGVAGHPRRRSAASPPCPLTSSSCSARSAGPCRTPSTGVKDPRSATGSATSTCWTNEGTRSDFIVRARLVAAIRSYLDAHGFVEVETPILQPRYGGAFADPFVTHLERARPRRLPADRDRALSQAPDRRWARACLRDRQGLSQREHLVQAPARVHHARVVRGICGLPRHDGRIEDLIRTATEETLGTTRVSFRGHEIDFAPPWRRARFVEALGRAGAVDSRRAGAPGVADGARLSTRSRTRLVAARRPRLLAFRRARADRADDRARLSCRASRRSRARGSTTIHPHRAFEYFVGGMELGNAFSEIQRCRHAGRALRERRSSSAASRAIPTTSRRSPTACRRRAASASGIDRLAMVLTGRDTIRDVILFRLCASASGRVTPAAPTRCRGFSGRRGTRAWLRR